MYKKNLMKIVFMLSLIVLTLTVSNTIFAADNLNVYLQGVENYYQGNYSQAIDNFSQALKNAEANKITIDSLYFQTLSFIEQNNVSSAKHNIEKLKQAGYEFGILHWKLGNVYLNKEGQFDSPFYNEAKKQLEQANMLGIDAPQFHSDLAMAYQGLGNLEQAAKEYELALSNGGKAGDYINLALIYKENDQLQKAIDNFKQALKLNPEQTSIYLNLGNIYVENKNYEVAINTFKQGVDLNPSFVALRFQLAKTYYLNNKFDNAIKEFSKVIELNKHTYNAYYYLGKIYSEKDDLQKAIYNFKQAIKYNSKYVAAYIALGDIYLKQQNYYKAIAQYSTAIENNNNYPVGHFHLAQAYLKLDMTDSAISELRKTIHLDSNNQKARGLLDKLLEN